jgi:hypothetical protein
MVDVTGRLSISTTSSTSWPFGTAMTNVQAATQIAGVPGDKLVGGYNPALPEWSGTLGANGTTLTASPTTGAAAPAPDASPQNDFPKQLNNRLMGVRVADCFRSLPDG